MKAIKVMLLILFLGSCTFTISNQVPQSNPVVVVVQEKDNGVVKPNVATENVEVVYKTRGETTLSYLCEEFKLTLSQTPPDLPPLEELLELQEYGLIESFVDYAEKVIRFHTEAEIELMRSIQDHSKTCQWREVSVEGL